MSFHQLFSDTALALQPLLMDALGTACRIRAKFHHEMLKDVSLQKLLLAPILSTQPVDSTQTAVALRAAPQLLKVVAVAPEPPSVAPRQVLSKDSAFLPGFPVKGEVEVLGFLFKIFWLDVALSGLIGSKEGLFLPEVFLPLPFREGHR